MVQGPVQVEPESEKPLPGASPREDRPYLRPLRPAPVGPLAWVVGLLILLAGAGVAYYFWRSDRFEPLAGPPRAERPARPEAAAPPAAPAIQHPLETPSTPESLPPLAQSDDLVREALARLLGSDALAALLQPERIVARIVVTVDNLPRRSVPARMLPLRPVPGNFQTTGGTAIDPRNAARYEAYVALVRALDARAAVDLYVRFYPLFQKSYAELGDPRGYFNDRVVAAIDDLLAAPEVKEPPALARPGVLYQFADPALESRSAGQKLMLRIGAGNAAQVKVKLREIRAELARRRAR